MGLGGIQEMMGGITLSMGRLKCALLALERDEGRAAQDRGNVGDPARLKEARQSG